MMHLIVMSKTQELLDNFFKSLFSTIKETDDIKIWAVTENCTPPKDLRIEWIKRTEFNPNKYFNIILSKLSEKDVVGIVNDDICFTEGWYEDISEKFRNYDCVSPGFIETKDMKVFHDKAKETRYREGITEGVFDAFYCFPVLLWKELGNFDESVISWYDIDWYIRMVDAGYKPVISNKVTIMHLKRMTFRNEEPFRKGVKSEIIKKYGGKKFRKVKAVPIQVRRVFHA